MTDQPQDDADQEPLYRHQAYQQRGRVAPIDGILRVSAPREWLTLVILAVAIAAVIVWSVVGRLESGISAACTLVAAGERHVAVAPASGVVTEVLVEPGGPVSAGDPLLRVAAPEISLASDMARARSAALAAQHPGSPEAVGAEAEAQALQAAAVAGTLVLSPASGVLAPSVASAGTAVNPGSVVAEVLRLAAGPPAAVLTVDSSAQARIGPPAGVSVRVTPAGEPDAIRADARLSQASPGQLPLLLPGTGAPGTGSAPGAASALLAVEFDDPPTAFAALAQQPETAYACEARIVTDSRRPIQMLIGRS